MGKGVRRRRALRDGGWVEMTGNGGRKGGLRFLLVSRPFQRGSALVLSFLQEKLLKSTYRYRSVSLRTHFQLL